MKMMKNKKQIAAKMTDWVFGFKYSRRFNVHMENSKQKVQEI